MSRGFYSEREEEQTFKPANFKNKHYFLRQAIIRTIITGLVYLLMPVWANIYDKFIPKGYPIYQFIGALVLLGGNLLLLIQSWALALDKDVRKDYFKDN